MSQQPFNRNASQLLPATRQPSHSGGVSMVGEQPTSPSPSEDTLSPSEVHRVSAALEIGKQQEDALSVVDEFKKLLQSQLCGVLYQKTTAADAKKEIRAFVECLSPLDKVRNRIDMQEAARHYMSVVEDIIQEMPALLM